MLTTQKSSIGSLDCLSNRVKKKLPALQSLREHRENESTDPGGYIEERNTFLVDAKKRSV